MCPNPHNRWQHKYVGYNPGLHNLSPKPDCTNHTVQAVTGEDPGLRVPSHNRGATTNRTNNN